MGALDLFPKFPKREKKGAPGFPEVPAPPLGGREKREGKNGAAENGNRTAGGRPITAHLWNIRKAGRAPFRAWCVQGATRDEVLAQWPGAEVEPIV